MQIVLHTGVHHTDDDRLVKCLLKNKEDFGRIGVNVPGPSRYRRLLRDAMQAQAQGQPAEGAREVLLDAILEQEHADRLLLSNDNFFGVPKLALSDGILYPRAEQRLTEFLRLFPGDEVELFMALRDPATFLPALFASIPGDDFAGFMGATDPMALRWSELIQRIRAAVPQVSVTVWCNEDTPLIWAHLIREMAGLEPGTKITGGFDLLSEIMSREGMKRFRAYLKEHPNMTEMQKRRVIAAFLDKFAREEAIEEVVDLPGWTDELVETLGEIYDEDVFAIERIPGVTLIAP